MYHSAYFGINIYRNTEFGYKLRWTSGFTSKGRFAADTLDGIKNLIRDYVKGEHNAY